jgi:hypothetical protein
MHGRLRHVRDGGATEMTLHPHPALGSVPSLPATRTATGDEDRAPRRATSPSLPAGQDEGLASMLGSLLAFGAIDSSVAPPMASSSRTPWTGWPFWTP